MQFENGPLAAGLAHLAFDASKCVLDQCVIGLFRRYIGYIDMLRTFTFMLTHVYTCCI